MVSQVRGLIVSPRCSTAARIMSLMRPLVKRRARKVSAIATRSSVALAGRPIFFGGVGGAGVGLDFAGINAPQPVDPQGVFQDAGELFDGVAVGAVGTEDESQVAGPEHRVNLRCGGWPNSTVTVSRRKGSMAKFLIPPLDNGSSTTLSIWFNSNAKALPAAIS